MRNVVARWVVFGALAAGCVEQPPPRRGGQTLSQQEIEAVRRRVVLSSAPTPQHRLDYNFGNKVTLIGYDIRPAEVRPGNTVTITWYWRCDQPTGDGWRIFTHLNDANQPRANHDNDGDVRRAYQPERWRRGEIIRDEQSFEIPADWDSPVVKVYVGLWNEGVRENQGRMRVVRGEQDSESRALAMTLPTGVQVRVSELDVPRASSPITIDGNLNDPAWLAAATTGPLVSPMTGAPAGAAEAHGSVRVLWDSDNLYLGWEVNDDNLVETAATRDARFWENDAVEVLIDPDGNGRDYYEIQVSPGGHTFDSLQPQPPVAPNFGNVGWNPELNVRVTANGTLTVLGGDAGTTAEQDTDRGYTVEMAIPWSQIANGAAHTPPQPGDSWRVNFFLMDKPRSGGIRQAAWSPPRSGAFHTTERFGRLTFRAAQPTQAGNAPGATTPPPAATAPATNTAPSTTPAAPAPAARTTTAAGAAEAPQARPTLPLQLRDIAPGAVQNALRNPTQPAH